MSGNGEHSQASMEVSRRRGVSPPPRRSAHKDAFYVGDATEGRVAGTISAQQKQKPYIKEIKRTLKTHYPSSTHIGAVVPRFGGFACQVNVYGKTENLSQIETSIKKKFPHATVKRTEGMGGYEWFFKYVEPTAKIAWGSVGCDFLILVGGLGGLLYGLSMTGWI